MKYQFSNKPKCYDDTVTLYIVESDNIPYVIFTFCCEINLELIRYPLEDVCENFNIYYERCCEIIRSLHICENCDKHSDGNLLKDQFISLTLGTNFKCTHGCKFCVSQAFVQKRFNVYSKYKDYNKRLMEAIIKNKPEKLYTLTPASQGEPLEDEYTRNTFLFSLHETYINHICLLTNGVYADEEFLKKFGKYITDNKITVYTTVNIAGFNKKTYESYCKDDFDTVIKNINNMFKYIMKNEEDITILYIISNHNMNISKTEIIKQFKECFPGIDPEKHLELRVDAKLDGEIRDKLSKNFFETTKDTNFCSVNSNEIGINIFTKK